MREKLIIKGGKPLHGEVSVGGAKNAAVAIIPAIILCDGECVLENLPDIDDVDVLKRTLAKMGAKVQTLSKHSIKIDPSGINVNKVTFDIVTHVRASYYILGALMSKFKDSSVKLPGGCAIGVRPIDQHIKGFKALGAQVNTEYGMLNAKIPDDGLKGADIYLDCVSVGATINIMLAAVKAKGTTTIVNAAKEPHVVDVANMLRMMGAKILGAGTDVIKVRGVQMLKGVTYSIIPDQIETGTLMVAAAGTNGDVKIKNVIPHHMEALSAKMMEMGVKVEEGDDYIRVHGANKHQAANVRTLPYPGFPTDLQQPVTVLLSTAIGTSMIEENMFEARFKHINEIRRMGAKVTINGRVAVVQGVEKLTGAPVRATDLRAGAALVIAGLMADGVTEISNVKYIDRGYDHIEEKFISLGAEITREKDDDDYYDEY
jgi:UDP-N-acetylglucosamine 1-carboxyvinyltransferase